MRLNLLFATAQIARLRQMLSLIFNETLLQSRIISWTFERLEIKVYFGLSPLFLNH